MTVTHVPGKSGPQPTPNAKPAPKPLARQIRRRAGRGALVLIAGLLAVSGIIRVSNGVGQVMALETMPAAKTASAIAGCEADPGTAALLAALQGREARLATDEAAIAGRKQALAIADQQIQARLAELLAAEQQLSATLALADTAAEDDLSRLTTVYENMKPKEAAALFEVMEPDFAAGFLGRMRADAAAGVMAGLTPATAYAVSVVLAGRNASVPKK